MDSSRADQSTANRSLHQQIAELQQELAVAQTLASTFFEQALAMLCIAGFDGYFKQLNPMWSQLLGYSAEELQAVPFLSFVHPDDVAVTVAAAEQLGTESRNVVSFENRYRCKDGSYRWLRWYSTPDVKRGLIYAVVQDITVDRADEEQLRIYQQLFQHALTGLLVFELEQPDDPASLRLISANPAASAATGVAAEQVVDRTFNEIFSGDLPEQLPLRFAALAREGGMHDFGELRFPYSPRGERVLIVQAFALPGQKVAIAFEDVTARKQAEAAAEQQARITALMLDRMNDGVIAVDANGAPTIFNPAAQRLFGTGPVAAEPSDWSAIYGTYLPDMLTPFPSDELPLLRAMRGEATSGVEMFVRHPGAPEGRWTRVSGQPLRGPDDTHLGAVIVCHDVTEQKQTELQLRRSEARFREIALNIPGAVFQFSSRNGAWRVDFVSERIAEIAGLSAAEVMDDINTLIMRVHPDDRDGYLASIAEAVERQSPWHFVGRYVLPDGQVHWWQADSRPLSDAAGEFVFNGVVVDITSQRQAEEALRHSLIQEEIIRVQRATLEELSTPLIPISDSIVVMPLIGAVDSRRAQQVLETLLNGIAQSQAKVAILDITGVSVVDTQVANAIIRAAQAVKLLGAQVMITGIRPEVAQTLVGLGVDLDGIITRGSLQSGIARAMQGLRSRSA